MKYLRAKVQDSGSSGGFVVEAEKYQTTSRHDAVLCRMRSAVFPYVMILSVGWM